MVVTLIIIFEDASNYLDLTKLPSNTLIISKRKLFGVSRNIVIEDLRPYVGLPGILLREGFNSIAYSYITLSRQCQKIIEVIKESDNVLLIAHGYSGFDSGGSIALISSLNKFVSKLTIIIIFDPLSNANARNKIKLYMLLKSLLLIHSLGQEIGKRLTIILIDSSKVNKKVLTALTKVLYTLNKYIEKSGLFIIGLKRLSIPINQVALLTKALNLKEKIKKIEYGIQVSLALLNKVLDMAPTQFWEKARKDKDNIWPIKYVLRRIREQRNKLIESVHVMLDTLSRSHVTLLPDKDILGKIVYFVLYGHSMDYMFKDEEFIMGIFAKYNYLKSNQYFLIDVEKVDTERDNYIILSTKLGRYVEKFVIEYFPKIPIVKVEDPDYWYMVLSMKIVNVFSTLLDSPIMSILNDLEKTYFNSLNVVITIDELIPPKFILLNKHIDAKIFSRIPILDIDGIYEVICKILDSLIILPEEEINNKIDYLSKVFPEIGKIVNLPSYYYVDLLEKIKYVERKINDERRYLLSRLYSVLKYISPYVTQ